MRGAGCAGGTVPVDAAGRRAAGGPAFRSRRLAAAGSESILMQGKKEHVRNSRSHSPWRTERRRRRDDLDAEGAEASRAGFHRLRALRHARRGRLRHAFQGRRAGGHGLGLRHPRQDPRPARRRSTGASRSWEVPVKDRDASTEYAVRYVISYEGDLGAPRALRRGRGGHRDPLPRERAGARQGPRGRHGGLRAVRARRGNGGRTPSATPGWRPSPTSTSAPRTPTGRSPTTTSRWSTTARSPTTGSSAARWSASGTASCRTATRSSSRCTWRTTSRTESPSRSRWSARSGRSTGCSPTSSRPGTSSAWRRTRWPRSRSCSTRATTSSPSPPRRWPSAPSFPEEIDTYDPYDEETRVWQA